MSGVTVDNKDGGWGHIYVLVLELGKASANLACPEVPPHRRSLQTNILGNRVGGRHGSAWVQVHTTEEGNSRV